MGVKYMADITVNFKGLTGILGSVTVDEAATVDALIDAISTEEGLDSNYYIITFKVFIHCFRFI